MLGYTRNHLLVLLAAIVCVMTVTSLLLMYFIPAPPSHFSIATGGSHQIYEGIGNEYREILARSKVDLRVQSRERRQGDPPARDSDATFGSVLLH
jgi:hypothetical protein